MKMLCVGWLRGGNRIHTLERFLQLRLGLRDRTRATVEGALVPHPAKCLCINSLPPTAAIQAAGRRATPSFCAPSPQRASLFQKRPATRTCCSAASALASAACTAAALEPSATAASALALSARTAASAGARVLSSYDRNAFGGRGLGAGWVRRLDGRLAGWVARWCGWVVDVGWDGHWGACGSDGCEMITPRVVDVKGGQAGDSIMQLAHAGRPLLANTIPSTHKRLPRRTTPATPDRPRPGATVAPHLQALVEVHRALLLGHQHPPQGVITRGSHLDLAAGGGAGGAKVEGWWAQHSH
jgi:hypothetical protein